MYTTKASACNSANKHLVLLRFVSGAYKCSVQSADTLLLPNYRSRWAQTLRSHWKGSPTHRIDDEKTEAGNKNKHGKVEDSETY